MKSYFVVTVLALAVLGAQAAGSEPISPFEKTDAATRQGREAEILLSDGTELTGEATLTRGKKLVIFDREAKKKRRIALEAVESIEVAIEEEGMHTPFRFTTHGDSSKVPLGQGYPWRKYVATVVLKDGKRIIGDTSALIRFRDEKGKKHKVILYKRQKGKEEETLEDVIYVKGIWFDGTRPDEEDEADSGEQEAVKSNASQGREDDEGLQEAILEEPSEGDSSETEDAGEAETDESSENGD